MNQGTAEAGVDYITATIRHDNALAPAWQNICLTAMQLVADDGNAIKPTSVLGYEGQSIGTAFFGQNEQGRMFRVSGPWADKLFQRTYVKGLHYARLDIQVTYRFARENKTLAERIYKQLNKSIEDKTAGRLKTTRLVRDNNGGSTVYVGSRSSDTFMRIYNKSAQAEVEEYRNCWRYELEAHNDIATALAEGLLQDPANKTQRLGDIVREWCTSRGVLPPWPESGTKAVLPSASKPASDVASKLLWLSTQVRPSINWLRSQCDDATIFAALGLLPPDGPVRQTQDEGGS